MSKATNRHPLRVLVADDDPDAVRSLIALLEHEGHEVKGVSTGRQTLDAVKNFAADVLLLDIGMPDMSGYDVADELRKRYGSARPTLIAITGRTRSTDKQLARVLGFDHYVSKPYDPNEVLSLVARGAR